MSRTRLAALVTAAALATGCAASAPVGAVTERTDPPPADAPMPEPLRALEVFEDPVSHAYGYRDAVTGEVVVEPIYPQATDFTEAGIASVVAEDGTAWVIDQTGEKLFESFFYDNGPDFYAEGLARFVRDGRVGFHDEAGVIVIDALYDFATPFEDGRAQVCVGCQEVREGEHSRYEGGQWGVIDRSGRLLEPLR